MKHKRQTLGKQSDDRDDEDSINSDGGKSGKLSSEKFLDDELSKKSCQGCEMPQVGNLCGTHEDVPDLGVTRGTNNNTPSATNNNTNFNNNSNGASSVGSSSSFDKLIVEEDSHSNEDLGGSHPSPRVSKKANPSANGASSTVSVKVEGRSRNSSCDRKIGPSKISPGVKDPSDPIAMKMSPKNSLPGTTGVNPTPMGMAPMIYPQMRKSSPTTATAIASATVTIQNVPNNVSPFASRASPQFPQYHVNQTDYRADRQKHTQMGYQMPHPQVYPSGDLYNPEHPTVNDGSQTYVRDSANNVSPPNMQTARTSRGRQPYVNYQPYYYNKNNPNVEGAYGNYTHGYQPEHGPYNHYNYAGSNMYPHDNNAIAGHMPPAVHMNHDGTGNYYPSENVQNVQKMHGQNEYHHAKTNYYENNTYNPGNQIPPTPDTGYIPQEPFPVAANPPVAIVNTNANVPVETNEGYNYHQYYGNEATHAAPHTTGTPGENSNSSSDFNFLSSLTTDYTPEYYQI